MAKFEKRLQARKLRKDGWSIRSIAKYLDISKGSASIWCRDLELTSVQRRRLQESAIKAGSRGRLMGAEANRRKKEEKIAFFKHAGIGEIRKLSHREFLVAGVALYWGEGSRKSTLAFSNSDPRLIYLMFIWFQKVMGVEKEEFMPRIFINEIHEHRIKKVIRFWSKLLELPKEQFYKPVLLKGRPKKVYDNHDSYYGVLALKVRRSSELKYRILGLIDALADVDRIV